MTNSELNTAINNLTKKQKETYNSLVRLGDTKELALKTVLETKEYDDSMYRFAYWN